METHDRLIAAASDLFLERGYVATSVNDILRRADITKGGFYFHFASKDDLALAVIQTNREAAHGRILAAMSIDAPALDRFVALVRAAFAEYQCGVGLANLGSLCNELVASGCRLASIQEPFARWVSVSTELLTQAQLDGDIDQEIDVAAFSQIGVAAFFGLDLVLEGDKAALADHADAYLSFILRAAGARRPG